MFGDEEEEEADDMFVNDDENEEEDLTGEKYGSSAVTTHQGENNHSKIEENI